MIGNLDISLHSTILQSHGNIVSDMDGEKVMMNIKNGKYYNLGKIGGRIWELIGSAISVNQLVNVLISEFDVEEAKCKEHVMSFLKHLLEEGLIHFGEDGQWGV